MEHCYAVTTSQDVITDDILDAAGLWKVRAVKYPTGNPDTVKQLRSQGALPSAMLLKNCLLKTSSILDLLASCLQQIKSGKIKAGCVFHCLFHFLTHSPAWTVNNIISRISTNSLLLTRPVASSSPRSTKESCKGIWWPLKKSVRLARQNDLII